MWKWSMLKFFVWCVIVFISSMCGVIWLWIDELSCSVCGYMGLSFVCVVELLFVNSVMLWLRLMSVLVM